MGGVVFSFVFLSCSSFLICFPVIVLPSTFLFQLTCLQSLEFLPLELNLLLPISVMELHQKKNSKKSDFLVLGPAAGQGLPNRLQCEGSCSPCLYNIGVCNILSHFVDLIFMNIVEAPSCQWFCSGC